MNLRELEVTLSSIRKKRLVKLVYSGPIILQHHVIKKVEEGGNYYLSSLFRYLEALGFSLSINNNEISSLPALGSFIQRIREEANLSLRNVKHPKRPGLRELNKIESGEGGTRVTFTEYIETLEHYNIKLDFNIIDKYGITREKEKS